jgi:hypothetical protein
VHGQGLLELKTTFMRKNYLNGHPLSIPIVYSLPQRSCRFCRKVIIIDPTISILPHANIYDNYTEEIMTQTFTLPKLAVQLRLNINTENDFYNDTETMKLLMFLPSKSGGVGMTRHEGMTTEIALM